MDLDDFGSSSWQGGSQAGHLCNCIGCCKLCGSCRTAPTHTKAFCMLLQQQEKDRAALIANEVKWGHRVPAEVPLEAPQSLQDAVGGETGTRCSDPYCGCS